MATNASDFRDLPIAQIDISEFNTRKDIGDGQQDSTIEDLASSIATKGLLSPITVVVRPNGRFAVVAGQRRFIACRSLGWRVIPANVRDDLTGADATAVSLIENVHRADMNPRDKARAFGALMDTPGGHDGGEPRDGGEHADDPQIPPTARPQCRLAGEVGSRGGEEH